MAAILVLGAKVPYTRGGQEVLLSSLVRELKARGHLVDTVELPFTPLPKERLLTQAAMWRSLDLTEFAGQKVDLVIATKFPTYYAKHRRKSVWLVHQHRSLYDLYGSRYSDISDDPRDEALRRMLVDGDRQVLSECAFRSGISENVVRRLQNYNQLEAEVLYPPLPLAGKYRSGRFEPYVLSVGRICSIKRVDLMLKAMPMVHQFVKLKVVGTPDEPGIMEYFKNEIDKHHLWERVDFLGRVSDEDLIELYANAGVVYYAPHDEDYGYVTLEAMASGRPVVTASDSGGCLEFVVHDETGLVVAPTSDAMGHAVNRLVEDKDFAARLGAEGAKRIEQLEMSGQTAQEAWDALIARLLSPLSLVEGAARTDRDSSISQPSQAARA